MQSYYADYIDLIKNHNEHNLGIVLSLLSGVVLAKQNGKLNILQNANPKLSTTWLNIERVMKYYNINKVTCLYQ